MTDHSRIEDLRRRVQRDPASIAFAQLAEEHRRAGQLEDAVDVARAGLVQHPAYLSARVTLGRALLELGQLDEAAAEFEFVVQAAPDNLTAVRQLADIHQKRRHLTNETKSRMPEAPPLAASPATMPPSAPTGAASSSVTSSEPAKPEANPATQEVNTAKQAVDTAQQAVGPAPQAAPSPAPQFVVELTSQTAHLDSSPAVPPAAAPAPSFVVPPVSTSAAAESISQDRAKPAAPAPLDPVIAELEAWLAVLEEERASRAEPPHASR